MYTERGNAGLAAAATQSGVYTGRRLAAYIGNRKETAMKFTDGYWRLREGVSALCPVQIAEAAAGAGSLTIHATTKPIAARGDLVGGSLLTWEFSSPMADVLRIRLSHFSGSLPEAPQFDLEQTPAPRATTTESDEAVGLTSGELSVRIPRAAPWRMEFTAGGRPLTASPSNGTGAVETADGGHYLRGQLSLGVGECVYGLGERFTALVKNGQTVDIWNSDGGTCTELAYKNVPFYLTNRGYGVFVNHPGRVSFEAASERTSQVQFSVAGQSLEYFLIYGPSPREVLEKYTALTGRPALPPAWSFGLWLSTSFATDYDEQTVAGFIQGMADRDLPLSVFHFDCFWMREFHWCDFEWDRRVFPDPAGMLRRLKERGLKICVWINPYIGQRSALFAEGARNGYLLRKADGSVWQNDSWQPGLGIVDFTNPAARKWYADKLTALIEMGVDCFKTDFGESIPVDAVYHDGSDPGRMHNFFTFLYNRTVFELLQAKRGRGEAAVFARSATAGSQRFPVHWGGDCESTFEGMAESLRGGLSLGLSGFGFWSHDIGGFEGTPPAALYKRWIAFGLLSSHSRLHGDNSYRVPWLFDGEAVEVLRHFTKLKLRLMPYLFSQAVVASRKGYPLMRAMMFEFPEDPACDTLDRQYMLGESFLVAPVFSAGGEVAYYLPGGRWTEFLTGNAVEGPGWRKERHGVMSLPLLVRPNTLLAVGGRSDRPDYEYADGVTLQLYALDDGRTAAASVPTPQGDSETRFTAARAGRTISIDRRGPSNGWSVLLAGIPSTESIEGGTAETCPQGVRVIPDPHTERVTITLPGGK
jgi:alpha-D-xyloside xylohydrolase